MTISVDVTLNGQPLPNQALGLKYGGAALWVKTGADSIFTLDDSFAGKDVTYWLPDVMTVLSQNITAPSDAKLHLAIQSGWPIPNPLPPKNGKIAVVTYVNPDFFNPDGPMSLLKNHGGLEVETKSESNKSITTQTDADGNLWLPESWVGQEASVSGMYAGSIAGSGWFTLYERGSVCIYSSENFDPD